MTFRGKRLDQLDVSDLQDLIGNVREGRTIDFKGGLPGRTREDRKEFLADVSSFANAAGGHLIFGIAEKEGVACDFSWLVPGSLDADAYRRMIVWFGASFGSHRRTAESMTSIWVGLSKLVPEYTRRNGGSGDLACPRLSSQKRLSFSTW